MQKTPSLGLYEAVVNNHGKIVKYLMTGTSHQDVLRQILMEKRLSPVSTRAMHQGFTADKDARAANVFSFTRQKLSS